MALLRVTSADGSLVRIIRRAFPLHEAVADDFHRGHCRMAQTGVAGNFATATFAFVAKHVTYALQFETHTHDFLHRPPANAPPHPLQISAALSLSLPPLT